MREFAEVGPRELECLLPDFAGLVLVSGAPESVAQVIVERWVFLAGFERDSPPEEGDGSGAGDLPARGGFVGDDVLVVAEPGERVDDAGFVGKELRARERRLSDSAKSPPRSRMA